MPHKLESAVTETQAHYCPWWSQKNPQGVQPLVVLDCEICTSGAGLSELVVSTGMSGRQRAPGKKEQVGETIGRREKWEEFGCK